MRRSAARRASGITLLHEAQAAGVATLLGCDNVQDAFCPAGSYDPLDTWPAVCSALSSATCSTGSRG